MPSPISFKVLPFCINELSKVSIDSPVSCPTFVSSPNTLPACPASTLNLFKIVSTLSILLFKSVSFISANSINCFDKLSNLSPVSWKRVLTSPIAVPAVSASVGISLKMLFMRLLRSSNASPVAPVLVIIMS